MTTTATVEVLTAEVRVLMVGSRQITRSVYRQLDIVPYDQVEAMGRVNERVAYADEGWIVGRDTLTGELVRAELGQLYPRRLGPVDVPCTDLNGKQKTVRIIERVRPPEYARALEAYRELPLIVLAGLR